MKGTFFNKPLEWNIETKEESWPQGSTLNGKISVKNHAAEKISLDNAGVALSYAEIKKVHAKTEGVLRPEVQTLIEKKELAAGESTEMTFSLTFPENCPVSDKKSSYFLTYGRN